jgi:dienelactone hydrolase
MSRRCLAHLGLIILGLFPLGSGPLSGTKSWDDVPADRPMAMVQGLHDFLDRETEAAVARRAGRWKRDYSSRAAYEASVEPNRRRLARMIGATGERVRPASLTYLSGPEFPAPLSSNKSVKVTAVRWAVYPGFDAEGLLLEPIGEVKASVVVIPDPDWAPELTAGIARGALPISGTAWFLAESGCRVIVPTLIDRSSDFSGSPLVRSTNLTHREWIYRMAYEAGRHLIGYEVDEVRAAVDWLTRDGQPKRPIGVIGHGEGAMIAMYTAALDTRIDAVQLWTYFGARERVWSEPIYRNLFGQLEEFCDAEVASLILPRTIVISSSFGPSVKEAPKPKNGRNDAASGRIEPVPIDSISSEFERLEAIARALPFAEPVELYDFPGLLNQKKESPQSRTFLKRLGLGEWPNPQEILPADPRPRDFARHRMARLVRGMEDYTREVLRTSELRRETYWSKADRSTLDAWQKSTEPYRETFWEEILGKFPAATEPLDVQTKQVYDEPRWTGYAVKIPVWRGSYATGVILLPKDLKPGERRPVVVCQHGLEGTPEPVVDPRIKSVYNSFGAQLADRGYIVYAPQNPYTGHDDFRKLQRKANPLGKSLFGLIVRQHERTLEWLKTRPEVAPDRIAFYGLSYGGKTAMRVPAVLKDYCLSICSADFNEWVVKCTNTDRKYSYLYTLEYDMYEFGLAERFNYAEMAALIAPRPFMVERGHDDGVAPDEWIGYEFAKVKRTYDKLGVGDRAELAIFNGGHQIDGKASFAFLAKHLDWPRGSPAP